VKVTGFTDAADGLAGACAAGTAIEAATNPPTATNPSNADPSPQGLNKPFIGHPPQFNLQK
jgi:hypothetical protein